MVSVRIGAFRNQVSRYIRRARNGESILILDRAKPVAILTPCPRGADARLLGGLKGSAKIRGDIVGPVLPIDDWFRS